MGYRLTKIYTRKGDKGHTTIRGEHLPKDDVLFEAVGTLDELNAHLGLLASFIEKDEAMLMQVTQIQHELFDMGGELHAPTHPVMTAGHVKALEVALDHWNDTLPPLKEFVLSRGERAACVAHIARTVCRRAERAMVRLQRQTALENPESLRYLNRLSDLLFVIARILARKNGEDEILWQHERHK